MTTEQTTNRPFSFSDAFALQTKALCEWAAVLNTDAYLHLIKTVMEANKAGYDSPFKVLRGQDIDFIVIRYASSKI